MKKWFSLLFVVVICVLVSSSASAQITAVSEQKLQELINEVRQLRVELQRMNANAYRVQLLLERQREQQFQVNRLTQQLSSVREQLIIVPSKQRRLKEQLEAFEKQKASGLVGDDDLKALNREIDDTKQIEQNLLQRELQLASDLQAESANLNDLKTRLDKLEQEIVTPSSEPAKKRE